MCGGREERCGEERGEFSSTRARSLKVFFKGQIASLGVALSGVNK